MGPVKSKIEHPILILEDYEDLEKMEQISAAIRKTAAQMGGREPRYLVDNYYRVQGIRLIAASQKRAAAKAEEPIVTLDYFLGLYKHSEPKGCCKPTQRARRLLLGLSPSVG